jgi:glycosyltransferase involved in cell wall biosynthesis
VSTADHPPCIAVAIPHYRHRQYLEAVLDSIMVQDCDGFEIVVSDDCSPDDSAAVIPAILERSGRPFRFYHQPANLGYDGNVRFCLAASLGRYVFLLGNDDALAGPSVISDLIHCLTQLGSPAVAFTNHTDWASDVTTRRVRATQLLGAGPETAIRFFRSFSFVSGLVYDRQAAQQHETDRWDRSVYYQIYLATRIIAAGGRLAAIDLCTVRKDVRLDGRTVPNYVTKAAEARWSFQRRETGLTSVLRVTADATMPFLPESRRSAGLRNIAAQLLTITYPFWLFEYRRVANWSFSVGIARSLWPAGFLAEHNQLRWHDRLILWFYYFGATGLGLVVPSGIFGLAKGRLANLIRSRQQHPHR